MTSLFQRLRRWWAKAWDGRVIAPRAYVVTDPATGHIAVYLPPAEYDALPRVEPRLQPWAAGIVSPALFGTPVFRMPEAMDRKHYDAEWRRGGRRV